MCQLSVVNLNDRKLNQIADYLLSFGESKFHGDGFGIMQLDRHTKTKIAPILTTNWGSFTDKIIKSSSPIYSHIRQASHGIEVCDENSHPFESESFLLMHNGTLIKTGETKSYAQGRESDSKIFLQELEKNYVELSDFVAAFNKTMSGFWGKFAFLIYAKKEKKNYIIRGLTAHLYKVDLIDDNKNVLGFMINTDKENLERCALMISNISQILNKTDLKFSDAVVLQANSIFVHNENELTRLSDTKENEEVKAIQKAHSYDYSEYGWWGTNKNNKSVSDNKVDDTSSLYKICTFQTRNYYSPRDMALIYSLYMGGRELLQATEEELKVFADKVLPRLTPKGGISTLRFLKNELKEYKCIPMLLYTTYGLEYPWTINPQKDVISAVRKYNKDTEKARNEKLT